MYQFKLFRDGRSCLPYVSEGIRRIFRLEPEAVRDDGGVFFAVVHAEDRERIKNCLLYTSRCV